MQRKKGDLKMFYVILLLGIGAIFLLSLCWGQFDIPFKNVLAGLFQAVDLPLLLEAEITPEQQAVLYHIRMPRTLVGFMVGAGLAASGAVMQGVFHNPLADPAMLGVSSGAALGAVVAIALGFSETSVFCLPVFAFAGAAAAVAFTVLLAMRRGKFPALALLLSGVVVGILLSAVTAEILAVASAPQLQQYLFWTIGGLDYRRWEHVLLGIGPIFGGIFLMLLLARHLNILILGEVEAKALGMPTAIYRLFFLMIAAMTTAASVCISGNIGFVGLVVPHMMRLFVGTDHRRLLPASILAGGGFLVLCDTIGRVVFPATEIRVGIMTAFLGAPYFLYLLRRQAGRE